VAAPRPAIGREQLAVASQRRRLVNHSIPRRRILPIRVVRLMLRMRAAFALLPEACCNASTISRRPASPIAVS